MVELAKALFAKVQADDVPGAAAELAFRFMFALFPLLIFLTTLGSYIAGWLGIEDPAQAILREAGEHLPDEASGLIEGQLEGIFSERNPGLLSLAAIGALWAASSGTKTVMKVLNRIYGVDEARPFIRKQATGLLLTVIGGLSFLVAALVLMVGQVVGQEAAAWLGVGDAWGTLVTLARIPLVLALLMVAVSLIYWSAPNARLPFHWLSWGGIFFVVTWLIATLAFGTYVANFGAYNATYGSLGSVMVLMTWLFLTSLLLLVGAALNVVLEDSRVGHDEAEAVPAQQPQETAV